MGARFVRSPASPPIESIPSSRTGRTAARHEPIQAIEPLAPLDAIGRARARLGLQLFSDKRLSRDASISCASCHDVTRSGADGQKVAMGVGGRKGTVNTPTIFNAAFNVKQFWDGRADSLELQVDGPLQNPVEMASSWPAAMAAVNADEGYRAEFARAYPAEGVSIASIRDAIACYERTLVTRGSRFDQFLDGDATALSPTERAGYDRFKSYGCVSCHQGRAVGGNVFEKLGIMRDYFADRGGELVDSDYGRFNVTKREEDRFTFKVPSLRQVAATAPYFHDGSAATLDEAVVRMARYQLGEELSSADVASIVAFLGSLAGTYDAEAEHAGR